MSNKYIKLKIAINFGKKSNTKTIFQKSKHIGKQIIKFLPGFLRISPGDIFIGIFAVIFTLALISIATYFYFARDLGSKENIMNRNNTGIILTDRNGQV